MEQAVMSELRIEINFFFSFLSLIPLSTTPGTPAQIVLYLANTSYLNINRTT